MYGRKHPKLSRFVTQIDALIIAIGITVESLVKRQPMARPLRPPIKRDPEPDKITLRERNYEVWRRDLLKREAYFLLAKRLEAPKPNG